MCILPMPVEVDMNHLNKQHKTWSVLLSKVYTCIIFEYWYTGIHITYLNAYVYNRNIYTVCIRICTRNMEGIASPPTVHCLWYCTAEVMTDYTQFCIALYTALSWLHLDTQFCIALYTALS